MENLHADAFIEPFPHLIIKDFYNDDELKLIWEELDFLTKPNKLMGTREYGGVVNYTNAKALILDDVYSTKYRPISNILTTTRKMFDTEILNAFSNVHDCLSIAKSCNWDITKVRYYHDGDDYRPHVDMQMQFLAFSYFFKEPKKFEGGELYFPDYDYQYSCNNNSIIMLPGWVKHGVKKVTIKDSDYFDGYGRYSITTFFSHKERSKNVDRLNYNF